MSRLITFGDSFTYGHGLVDCHVPPNLAGPECSKLSWPQLLGDMLGIEVINKATPGNSNIEILRDILKFEDLLPSDIVAVGWTFVVRDCIFKKNIFGVESEFRLNVWNKETNFIKKYFEVHTDHDLAVKSGLHIHHAESYLKTKQVKQYHFCMHQEVLDVMPKFTLVPENFIEGKILPRIDKALDNSHPGPLSQQEAAKKLYEIINAPK